MLYNRFIRHLRFVEGLVSVMESVYTAVIQHDDPWWFGWVIEIPGVNSQGKTRQELVENLNSALEEALEMNRADALAAISGEYEEVALIGASGRVT